MNRQTEFPDFDNGASFDRILEALAPFGAVDSSWRNDTNPSIWIGDDNSENGVKVWIDYANRAKREDMLFAAYAVTITRDCYDVEGHDFSTESDALEFTKQVIEDMNQ